MSVNNDLDEILQVFFEETDDHLTSLETLLSELRPSKVSDATVNAILRAAHSIKGNSATCGLNQVSKVAHEMESLLDVHRQKNGGLTAAAVRLLLEGKDFLSASLQAYKSGREIDEHYMQELCHRLEQMKAQLPPYGSVLVDTEEHQVDNVAAPPPVSTTPSLSAKEKLNQLLHNNERTLQIIFVLNVAEFKVEHVFQALAEFGDYTVVDTRTPKNQGYGQRQVLYHLNLVTMAPEKEIRETLGFVVQDEDSIQIDVIQGPNHDNFGLFDIVFAEDSPAPPPGLPAFSLDDTDPWGMDALAKPEEKMAALQWAISTAPEPTAPVQVEDMASAEVSDPLLAELAALDLASQVPSPPPIPEEPEVAPASSTPSTPILTAGPTSVLDHPLSNPAYLTEPPVRGESPSLPYNIVPPVQKPSTLGARQFQRAADRKEAAQDAISLRVNLQKVESVVDLVGELVIAQDQLQQSIQALNPSTHAEIFDALTTAVEHTKALQESVLSIRMTPMSTVFNRFYRMVRELNLKLGKHVVMKTMGETTEMDKMLVDKLVDPLAHIIRNAMDHGIETPADRKAANKPEQGYILLRAFHRANAVVIEILDDGRGMSREKLLAKATEKKLLNKAPEDMSDSEVWNLIFEPGFSTASSVSDVSGRGVGMDVVRQNIQDLNGKIDVYSAYGKGMKITLTLPLTLSILDGMFVRVSGDSFVVPMSNLVKTMTPDPREITKMKGFGHLVKVGDQQLPVINLHELFSLAPSTVRYTDGVWLVLESGNQRIVVWVEKMEGQQQIVLKSLERNYRRSAGIFGATIRNDGTVSLVLEPADVIEMAGAMQEEQWVYTEDARV